MRQELIEVISRTATVLAVSTATTTTIVDFFEIHATSIGAICTVLSLVVMLFFNVLNRIKLNERDKNLERLDHMDQSISDIKALLKPKGKSDERK